MPLNYLSNSPWQAASDSVAGTAHNMNSVALGVARLRYQQALMQQRQALAMGQLALRAQLAEHQSAHYDAQTQQQQSLTAINQGKLESANQMQRGYQRQYPQDPSQGPSMYNAQQMNLGDIMGGAAKNAALSGKGYEVLMPHNIGANQIAITPGTGELAGQGMYQLAPGHMAQVPGQEPVINPQLARDKAPSYGYASGLGIFDRSTGDVKTPAPVSGIKPAEAYRILGNPNYELDDASRTLLWKAATNAPAMSQGQHQPNLGGAKGQDFKADAMEAISKGADPMKVKERYKQLTGQEADF